MGTIDSSKPSGSYVNNFVDQVCSKLSYKSVEYLVDNMKQSDFIATIDIKYAYRVCSDPLRQLTGW